MQQDIAFIIAMGQGCFLILSWMTLLLFPGGWVQKLFIVYKYDVGLMYGRITTLASKAVEVDSGPAASSSADLARQGGVLNKVHGSDAWLAEKIREMYEYGWSFLEYNGSFNNISLMQETCLLEHQAGIVSAGASRAAMPVHACSTLGTILYGSMAMLFCGIVGVAFLIAGCACLYHYCRVKPRHKARKIAMQAFCWSVFFFTLGLSSFAVATWNVSFLPHPWVSSNTAPYGWAYLACLCLLPLNMLLPAFVEVHIWGDYFVREGVAKIKSETKKAKLEAVLTNLASGHLASGIRGFDQTESMPMMEQGSQGYAAYAGAASGPSQVQGQFQY